MNVYTLCYFTVSKKLVNSTEFTRKFQKIR